MSSDPGIFPTDSATKDYDWIYRNMPHVFRVRVPAAQINAGYALLPARPGVSWRLLDLLLISIGGAAAGATDVRILATLVGASRALAIAAVAGLTQSTMVRAGSAAVVMLANGESLTPNDVNTPVTLGKTGGALTGATHLDVIVTYADDRA